MPAQRLAPADAWRRDYAPSGHAGARRAAVGRRLPGAVDARREPDQVAPRAHHLVLRDLRARALRAAASCPSTPLPRAVQQLLPGRRRAAPARAARPDHAADAGRGEALPRQRRRAHAAPAGHRGAATPSWRRARHARPAPRAAAPGAAADRHQARAVVQPDARLREALADDARAAAAAALVRLRRRADRARPRRRRSTAPSASTTRRRATAPTPRRSSSPRGR